MLQKNSHIPTIFVVLGATGDLMTKKIVPAVFNLHTKRELPAKFEFVGVSRRDWSDDDFRAHVHGILEKKVPGVARGDRAQLALVESFLKLVCYHQLTFDKREDYAALAAKLEKIDARWGVCTNKLFYLSVPPQFYDGIFEHLHASGLTAPCSAEEGWTRVIVEKPFGNDERTAKALDAKLARLFKEEQIYRIDHYLAKEMLQNILAFRFANNLFERKWDAKFIERINIRMYETIGAEDRGAFYDGVGALRDVGQNHLLQMLALVAMPRPANMEGAAAIRAARAEILEQLEIPTAKQAAERSFRAQYEGFQKIKGVAPRSQTESYFKLRGFLCGERWAGVPIYMESGKRLKDDVNEIEIVLREDAHAHGHLVQDAHHNRIIIQIEPVEGITVTFYSKKLGHAFELEERKFEFDFRKVGAPQSQYTEEYEKLILDCIEGDQTLFVSSREIAAMWRFTDPFTAAWQKGMVSLAKYKPDTDGVLTEADGYLENGTMEKGQQKAGAEVLGIRQFGLIGLGKMGANLARQLREKGWRVVVHNRTPEKIMEMEGEGFEGARDLDELVSSLRIKDKGSKIPPIVIWLMITAGKGVDEYLFAKDGLASKLRRGDIVIDGGNSFFEDSMRRAKLLAKRGVKFLDVGVSGGPGGARNGATMMAGGDRAAFDALEQLFADGSVPDGYGYFGKAGAGHFVKMVHNGIEYGMMQAIAEGFAVMRRAPFKLDLQRIAKLYQHGSVIESRLVGWLESGFKEFGTGLKKVSGTVAATGEGEWTVKTAKKWKVPVRVIEGSFKFRVRSKRAPSYTGKILSALPPVWLSCWYLFAGLCTKKIPS